MGPAVRSGTVAGIACGLVAWAYLALFWLGTHGFGLQNIADAALHLPMAVLLALVVAAPLALAGTLALTPLARAHRLFRSGLFWLASGMAMGGGAVWLVSGGHLDDALPLALFYALTGAVVAFTAWGEEPWRDTGAA